MDPEKICKVRDWPAEGLRRLGDSCPTSALSASLCLKLTEKGEAFFWGGPQQHAMDKMLTAAPILSTYGRLYPGL